MTYIMTASFKIMPFLNIGVQLGTNVQVSGVDLTKIEPEANNENADNVWVRPQRNRGVCHNVLGVTVACVVVEDIVVFVIFLFPWRCLCMHLTTSLKMIQCYTHR